MAVAGFFTGEITTELLKQLLLISAKAWRYKSTADNLITLIDSILPTIKEIENSGSELSAHRQAQIGMLSETLKNGKKLTEKILSSRRWNMFRQLYLMKKLEKLEKTLSAFLKAPVLTNILAEVHHLRHNSDEGFDQIDNNSLP